MSKLLIINAKVVNENTIRELDIAVENGRIAAIASDLSHWQADTVIDGQGKVLLPGMIDDQVHFREPGLTHKGEIATESKAAVAGGITSYMEMPNCNPQTVTHAAIEEKCQLAAEKSLANYAFYLGATNDNVDVIKSVNPNAVCGVKVFMGASTGNMLVDNPTILEDIFANCPVLIATHCEDTPTILANEVEFHNKYGDDIPLSCHPKIRSAEACYRSSSLAVDLAKKHGTKLHVLHLTTAKELELFSTQPVSEKNITAEVCVHHLFFNENDYHEKGNLIKCNPAIKTVEDQAALIQAVIDNKISVIATDHAPHTWDEKQQAYIKAPAGLPLVQHALLSLFEFYHRGQFSLELIAQKTSHTVAELYQIQDRGYIREGYWADLVLVDLDKPTEVTESSIIAKCGWSPFMGYSFKSSIDTTIVNGNIIFQQDKLSDCMFGQRLMFNR